MSGRYEPHAEYVPCGLSSWNEMPSHWTIGRIKFMTQMNPSKSEVRHLKSDTAVTFLPMEAIGDDGSLDVSKERPIHAVLNGYTYLAEGDVCVAKITPCFENGKGAIATGLRNGIGFATTEVIPMRCNATTDSQYLYYFLTCAPFNLDAEASMYGAGGQKRVADSFVANYSTAIPPLDEQKQIASFLDYETAKIDALIEKQQQLIALLGEKRQAVISHAVTKGLNPDAPMRDSGVEWLGEVPEHWDVINLNVVAEIGNGSTPDRSTPRYWGEEGDFPWLNSSVVNQTEVNGSDQYVTESALRECHLPHIVPPAVLVGITGQGKTRGMATILRIEATINQHVTFIQPRDERVSVAFIHRFFQMAYHHIRFESEGAGSTKGAITCGQLEKTKIPLPSPDEQDRIVNHLGEFATKVADLTAKAEAAVELLRERRTALISAAVTGKIDVRDWKPPSSSANRETEMELA